MTVATAFMMTTTTATWTTADYEDDASSGGGLVPWSGVSVNIKLCYCIVAYQFRQSAAYIY